MADDRGSEAVQAAIVTPLLIMFVCLALGGGRLVLSGSKIDAAAEDAAREASLARSAATARQAATAAAKESLTDQGIACANTSVSIDTSGLNAPLGQAGSVTVTVRCTVDLTDLLLPAPGSRTLSSTFTSVVDQYRQRALGLAPSEVPWNTNRSVGAER
ncbi:TadE/TadG family type IV pilus assembly protein [Streptomyces melanosporofaciens]|uniref:TadE/TadG family type IV pilus assembly protein n=1 Tax=Streptomyces melanosporofaciens TaxID=67327 RepID=UPI00244E7516|nr:TadE/TadG family type IV pilus assembly protein [Streptomyces melanosporofaciens]